MMQLLAPRWALFLAAAVGSTVPAAGQPASSPSHVTRLIAQLGSADYRQREAAHLELAAHGPAVVEPLERAMEGKDLEISLRARRLLHDLQRNAMWSGTRIRVSHSLGGRELVAAIRGQTGIDLAFQRDVPQAGTSLILLRPAEVEFWSAVDVVCAALDTAPRWQFTTCGKSRLVARDLGRQGIAAYNGALRCEISDQFSPAGDVMGETDGTELTLHLAWEPKLNLIAVQAVPRVVIAGTDCPSSAVSAPSGCTQESWHVTADGLPCHTATLRVRAPCGDADGPHVQSVQWGVIAVAPDGSRDHRTVRFEFHRPHPQTAKTRSCADARQPDEVPLPSPCHARLSP